MDPISKHDLRWKTSIDVHWHGGTHCSGVLSKDGVLGDLGASHITTSFHGRSDNVDDVLVNLRTVLALVFINLFDLWEHFLTDLQLCGFNDLIRHGFLHEIDFTLPYDFHELILQRNHDFWCKPLLLVVACSSSRALEFLYAVHSSALWETSSCMLDTWIHQKWVVFVGKVDVLGKMTVIKAYRCVTFHLE